MRKILWIAAVAFTFAFLMPAPAAQANMLTGEGMGQHRIGLGVTYWKTLDNIDEEFDNAGFTYTLGYQYAPLWYLKVGANLEYFPDLAGSKNPVLAPEFLVTAGGLFYGGVGIGIYYHDGNWGSSPFYMLRAGLDIPVMKQLFIDLNVNYRFNDWKTLEWTDLGTDTIRLGMAVRYAL